MKKKSSFNLDAQEKDILESVERGEWKTVKNIKDERAISKKAAKNTLKKDARINILLASSDLMRIKQKAAFEGISYQVLITSVLHKYAAGHFVD